MKNCLAALVFFLAFAVGDAFATERSEVNERWEVRRDGVVVEDVQKTTSMMIPSPGPTSDQIREIVRSELRRHTKESPKEIQKLSEKNSQVKTIVTPGGGTINIRIRNYQ